MKIGVAQITVNVGDVPANLTKIEVYAQKAAAMGCDAVVFPEMIETGYNIAAMREHGGLPQNRVPDAVGAIASRLKIGILCGIAERTEHHLYNTISCFSKTGRRVGNYRKMHLIGKEKTIFAAGEKGVLYRLGEFTAGLQICYDIRFPELSRALVMHGADLLVMSAAWPAERMEQCLALCRARAIENQCYLVLSNRCGTDENFTSGGESAIVTPTGDFLKKAISTEETILVQDLYIESIKEIRKSMRCLEDCRPRECYGAPEIIDRPG